ncbi:MAG: M1 family metallopeptidase [Bacteroidales bacterium]|nr:M1 family metallopeptidase [Bacteroidales bacterium]
MVRINYYILNIFLFSVITYTSPAQEITNLWHEGISDFNRQDYLGTIEKMSLFIRLNPESGAAYYNRAVSRYQMGDIDGACADFSAASDLKFNKHIRFRNLLCTPEFKLRLLQRQFYPGEHLIPEEGYRPAYTLKDTLRGALRFERTCFDVYFYNLTVRIFPALRKIKGNNSIYFHVVEDTETLQIDLFENLKIGKITWKGKPLQFQRKFDAVFVSFPERLIKGEDHIIHVEYEGHPLVAKNPPWRGGFIWKRDKSLKHWAGVACEHLGASVWWPNKDHLSDKPDSMGINIEVPDRFKVIANGSLRNEIPVNDKFIRYEWFVSYPIVNYNVTFYMGNYTTITDTLLFNNKPLQLNYYVFPWSAEKAKEHFKQSREILEFYMETFGEFPFWNDGFGLVESFYEGMEHQSAIAYGNGFDNKNSEYRKKTYDDIIVHEAAHEWWGNSVTAGDMADIWIHEGFATYAEHIFLEHIYGYTEYLYEISRTMNTVFNFWPMSENRDVNENAFASNDVYVKGASMIHNLRCTMNNDSLFFKMIKDISLDFKYKNLTTEAFIAYVNKYTQTDYSALFHKFIYDTGLPVLNYNYKREGSEIIFTYRWDDVEPGFSMPFALALDNNKSIRLEGTASDQVFRLKNTATFNFYNQNRDPEGAPVNSLVYFWTKYRAFKE